MIQTKKGRLSTRQCNVNLLAKVVDKLRAKNEYNQIVDHMKVK